MYRKALDKMQEKCQDEAQPYKEKYDARGYLDICLALSNGTGLDTKVAKALVQHKLGLVSFEVDEFTPALEHQQKSLELWQDLPARIQYDHADTIMDVCN